MEKATVYIDALTRTQEVLSLKWILKGAGYRIGSTWHDQPSPTLKAESHWNEFRLAELERCDELFLIFAGSGEGAANLAATAAIALARGIRVNWIGPSLPVLEHFPGLRQVDTVAELAQSARQTSVKLAA